MDSVDAGSRQSASLPPLNLRDMDKLKKDEAEYQRTQSTTAMINPLYPYPGPPPPYSQQAAANSVPGGLSNLISPPESRRPSENDKDHAQPLKHTLPSIHEVVGSDPSYPTHMQAPQAPVGQHHPSYHTEPTSDPTRRTYATDYHRQAPPSSYSHPAPQSPYMSRPLSAAPAPPVPPARYDPHPRPSFSTAPNSKLPALHPIQTGHSPVERPQPSLNHQYAPTQSPAAYGPPPQASSSMKSPFGYQYPSAQYPYPASAASAPGPMYPPTSHPPPPARYPSTTWKSDGAEVSRAEESKRAGRVVGPAYGESVKRHLENFDLEASLLEITDSSSRLLDFTRHYQQRAHQTQRSGPVPGSMPNSIEVDELLDHAARIQESLHRIHDVVITHQVAMAEQAHDPRCRPASYDSADPNSFNDDPKGAGGFAGPDSKKRRGRAAPPGRCHSCNRAETPEWRRGPDGARTLCNACGLHYAKLTRKMNGERKSLGGSNLRPKSIGPDGSGV